MRIYNNGDLVLYKKTKEFCIVLGYNNTFNSHCILNPRLKKLYVKNKSITKNLEKILKRI